MGVLRILKSEEYLYCPLLLIIRAEKSFYVLARRTSCLDGCTHRLVEKVVHNQKRK